MLWQNAKSAEILVKFFVPLAVELCSVNIVKEEVGSLA